MATRLPGDPQELPNNAEIKRILRGNSLNALVARVEAAMEESDRLGVPHRIPAGFKVRRWRRWIGELL